MADKLSYHDVTVYVDGVRYRPSDNYALRLGCCKAAGWQLWYGWEDVERLIGGEFDGGEFCITVGDIEILGSKPASFTDPKPFGWNGVVDNPPLVVSA